LPPTDTTFYGTFTANGAALGRPFGDMDPMFVRYQP
jgi:hypothetical protein